MKLFSVNYPTVRHQLKIALLFLPVAATFIVIRTYSVEMPFFDDWEFVRTLPRVETGSLQWKDIDVQQNEARILFPQLTYIALSRLAPYNVEAVIYTSYACLCLSLLILYAFFARIRAATGIGILFFLPVVLLQLAWRQYEGMLWAAHLPNTMGELFVLAAVYFCMRSGEIPICFPAAVVCAGIASFSAGFGLIAWPLGLGYFLLYRPRVGSIDFLSWIRRTCGWTLAAAVCGILYFAGYTSVQRPWERGSSFVLANLPLAFRYVLIYLGAPLSGTPAQARIAGMIVISTAIPPLYLCIRNRELRKMMFPALALVALVALTILPLLNNRLGLGVEQASASRYVTTSALALAGTYLCVGVLGARTRTWRNLRTIYTCGLCLGLVNSYYSGLGACKLDWRMKSDCAEVVRSYRARDNAQLACAYPDPGQVRLLAPALEQRHLSLFHDAGDAAKPK